jgi:hypothetical protein
MREKDRGGPITAIGSIIEKHLSSHILIDYISIRKRKNKANKEIK